jgi:hypothetical protein
VIVHWPYAGSQGWTARSISRALAAAAMARSYEACRFNQNFGVALKYLARRSAVSALMGERNLIVLSAVHQGFYFLSRSVIRTLHALPNRASLLVSTAGAFELNN